MFSSSLAGTRIFSAAQPQVGHLWEAGPCLNAAILPGTPWLRTCGLLFSQHPLLTLGRPFPCRVKAKDGAEPVVVDQEVRLHGFIKLPDMDYKS